MKGYGRAPTFLLATIYEQVRSIAALTGDTQAAARVEVDLPETGAWRAPKAELAANATCCSAPPSPAMQDPIAWCAVRRKDIP